VDPLLAVCNDHQVKIASIAVVHHYFHCFGDSSFALRLLNMAQMTSTVQEKGMLSSLKMVAGLQKLLAHHLVSST